jgi:hypothetical protein
MVASVTRDATSTPTSYREYHVGQITPLQAPADVMTSAYLSLSQPTNHKMPQRRLFEFENLGPALHGGDKRPPGSIEWLLVPEGWILLHREPARSVSSLHLAM